MESANRYEHDCTSQIHGQSEQYEVAKNEKCNPMPAHFKSPKSGAYQSCFDSGQRSALFLEKPFINNNLMGFMEADNVI